MTAKPEAKASTASTQGKKTVKQDAVIVLVVVISFIALSFLQLEIAKGIVLSILPDPDPLNVPWDSSINLIVLVITALETWIIYQSLAHAFMRKVIPTAKSGQ